MKIVVSGKISDQDRDRVVQGLKAHNTPFLNRDQWEDLFVLARDEVENVCGGLIAEREENWVFIKYLWVDHDYRGKHIGASMVERLEQVAKAKRCSHIMVETLSFQARPFYEKQGYTLRMTLDDCPREGYCCHYLSKTL